MGPFTSEATKRRYFHAVATGVCRSMTTRKSTRDKTDPCRTPPLVATKRQRELTVTLHYTFGLRVSTSSLTTICSMHINKNNNIVSKRRTSSLKIKQNSGGIIE